MPEATQILLLEHPLQDSVGETNRPTREARSPDAAPAARFDSLDGLVPWRHNHGRGRPLRMVYAFDPRRQAVLILGGDKTGDDRFYEWAIPKAEAIWGKYLEGLG